MPSENKIRSKDLPKVSAPDVMHDVIVIVPTANEFRGIISQMREILVKDGFEQPSETLSGARLFQKKTRYGSYFRVVVYSEDIRGNMLSAAHTAYICKRFTPKLVISAGIAGSLDPKRAWIGDVILPSGVEHAAFDKIYQEKSGTPDDVVLKGDHVSNPGFESPIRLVSRRDGTCQGATAIIGGLDFDKLVSTVAYRPNETSEESRLHQFHLLKKALHEKFGIDAEAPKHPRVIENVKTFSWDKVLDSRDIYSYLLKMGRVTNDAVCVEMESWGFLSAIDLYKRTVSAFDALIVRGISDIVGCKGTTDDKFDNLEGLCRRLAMSNVGAVVCHIIQDRFPK